MNGKEKIIGKIPIEVIPKSQHLVVALERVVKKHVKRKHILSDFSSEPELDQEVWICVICKEEWEADHNS